MNKVCAICKSMDFIKGSSLVATIPTFVYVGLAQHRNRVSALGLASNPKVKQFLSIPYELIVIGILASYGVATTVMNRNKDEDGDVHILKVLACGASLGLFLSTVGRFGLGLPVKMFNIPQSESWTVHPIAIMLYMIIMMYVNKVIN